MSTDTIGRNGRTTSIPVESAERTGTAPRWARATETAAYIGTTPDVLNKWRHLSKGPSYVVPPGIRSVLYDLNEVDRWLTIGRVEPVGQP